MNANQESRASVIWMVVLMFTFVLLNLSTLPIFAQSSYGAIVGTVTDSTGAVIPGAKVTLTNIGTSESKSLLSDAAGNFRFLSLPPTTYKVEINKENYKKVVQENVTVLVSMTARVDVALEVGSVSETVLVTTAAPLIQTDSGTLGTQVEGKTVQEMPLNGRNVGNLLELVPGVVPDSRALGNTTVNTQGHTDNSDWSLYQINGTSGGEAMMIDGASINILGSNHIAYMPSQDSVQEFKVSTSAVDPSIGRFAGGAVEMSSKSGSNSFHLSAYEYFRNTVLNAQGYFATTNPPWIQNQYGASAGGPILKEKLFFHANFEGFRSIIGKTFSGSNVPTFAMRGGEDFDQDPVLPGVRSNPTLDAAVQERCPGITYSATDQTMTIPQSCLDSSAKILRKFWAAPTNSNIPGVSPGTDYSVNPKVGNSNDQYSGRIDYNLGMNQRVFGRYMYQPMLDKAEDDMFSANGFLTAGAPGAYRTHQVVFGDTYTVSPKTIVDLRMSYVHMYDSMDPTQGKKVDYSKEGFSSEYVSESSKFSNNVQPWPFVLGGYNLHSFFPMTVTYKDWFDTYALSGSVVKVLGNHTLKFGGEARLLEHIELPNNRGGACMFQYMDRQFTGNAFANFLLGMPDTMSIGTVSETASYSWYQGYYINDSWAATYRLTLTAGLRWELPGGMFEKQNRALVLLPDSMLTLNGVANTKGSLALVNSELVKGNSTVDIKHNLFSPRVGFAYRFTDATVLRGGFSITYNQPDTGTGVDPAAQLINQATYTVTNNDSGSLKGISYMNNPFPNGFNEPIGRKAGTYGFMNNYAWSKGSLQSISGPALTGIVGYSEQWNFGLAHQLKHDMSVEASYTGLQNVKQTATDYLDQIDASFFSQIAALKKAGNSDAVIGNVLLRGNTPYPAYSGFTNTNAHYGQSNYNALQATVQKRFASAGQISSNYTWAKGLGNTSNQQNGKDHQADRALSSINVAHRAITNYVLNLPFGKGQKYANSLNGILDRVVSGWSVNGITTFQSGTPLELLDGNGNAITFLGAASVRPNYQIGCNRAMGGSAQARVKAGAWFNTSCFSAPDETTGSPWGNESATDKVLKGHGVANWDLSLLKATRLANSKQIQFRVECFNLFNRVQFATPGVDIAGGFGGAFGAVTSQTNNARQLQGSLRFDF